MLRGQGKHLIGNLDLGCGPQFENGKNQPPRELNRAGNECSKYLALPCGLTKSPVMGTVRSTWLIFGVFIFTCGALFAMEGRHHNIPNVVMNWAVFATVPIKVIVTPSSNLAEANRYGPPPYTTRTSRYVSPLEFIPSNLMTLCSLIWFSVGTLGGRTGGEDRSSVSGEDEGVLELSGLRFG